MTDFHANMILTRNTRYKFTQKPPVTVSQCAHAHEEWRPLCYMWKYDDSSSRKREPVSRNGLVFDDVCISKCQGTWRAYDAVTDEVRGEVQYNNRYLCSPSMWATIFTIIVHSSCSTHQRTKCYTNLIAFLYKVWQKLSTYIYIYIYIYTLAQYRTAVVKITCLVTLGN